MVRSLSNETNIGLFGTLSLAIGEARGRWVRLLSQDDVLQADCLTVEAKFHQRYPEAAMIHCLYDVIDESGKPIRMKPRFARRTTESDTFPEQSVLNAKAFSSS